MNNKIKETKEFLKINTEIIRIDSIYRISWWDTHKQIYFYMKDGSTHKTFTSVEEYEKVRDYLIEKYSMSFDEFINMD